MSGEVASAVVQGPQKVGVVVVHGVGETELGYAVNTLVKTLGTSVAGYNVAPHSTVIRLIDEEAPLQVATKLPVEKPEFRAVRREATHTDGHTVTFDELYWADLTNLKAGRLNALLGMFRVVFESHHLVNAMLDRGKDALSTTLSWLLLIAGWLMRGPLAGLTIATSAICAVLMFGPVTGSIGELSVGEKFTAVQAVLLVSGFGLLALVAYFKDVSWYDTAFWLVIVTVGLLALERTITLPEALKPSGEKSIPVVSTWIGSYCFTDARAESEPKLRSLKAAYEDLNEGQIVRMQSDGCYINGPYRMIVYGWRLWGAVMVSSILLFLCIYVRGVRSGDRSAVAPAATGIGIVILQFMLWTLIVVTALFPMLNRAESVKDLLAVRKQLLETKVNIKSGAIAKIMEFPAVDLDWIGRFKFVYGAAATTLVGFVIIAALILARRWWVAYRHRSNLQRASDRMPALLFNGWLLAWLMLAVFSVILFIWITKTPEHPWFEPVKGLMLGIAGVAALLAPALLLERVSNGVHIARDLIDHQYNPKLETGTIFMPRYFATKSKFPRRTHIEARLEAVMARLGRDGPFDKLIFVGHSQGSVVIYDYIRHRAPYVTAFAKSRPNLLTIGSPIRSIYQKYYMEYAGLATGSDDLAGRLSAWLNLYRVDDYVGGPIAASAHLPVENTPMTAGGHMDYWREPEVAKALDRLIRGVAATGSRQPGAVAA